MSRIDWKSRRTFGLVALVLLYLTFRVKKYDYSESVVLRKTNPKDVWEFVADFSNMKYLNPTITDFNILDESGNFDHWKYSIEYVENLSHWPYSTNTAIAKYDIKADQKFGNYLIHSVHKTCFLLGLYCLDSESNFRFRKNHSTSGAFCKEEITYQCPAIFSYFCEREVVYQRQAIMLNLQRKFT